MAWIHGPHLSSAPAPETVLISANCKVSRSSKLEPKVHQSTLIASRSNLFRYGLAHSS
jgi:hypothetical protein